MERTDLLTAYFHWECDMLSSVTTFHCLFSVPKTLFLVVPVRGPKLYSLFIHWNCSVSQLLHDAVFMFRASVLMRSLVIKAPYV